MKRKPQNTGGGRKDSPVLTQIAKLIDVRLPDQHGFALLTFPLGAAVDPVMRYVGKGDRDDILTAMQAWIDQQRQKGGPYWGTHDMAAAATQWTSQRPTAPGLYLLKHPNDAFPSYIRITDDESTGALSMDEWIGEQFAASFEDFAELAPEHIWLGPIPQPWNLGLQTVAPEPAEPSNVTPIGDHITPESELETFYARIDRHHGEDLEDMIATLTAGVPAEGGNVQLDTMRNLLKLAFQTGVLAEHEDPMNRRERIENARSVLGDTVGMIRQQSQAKRTENGHQHAEAFMLMKYRSQDGRTEELIWNSRDGVTPFMVMAKDGKTVMEHVEWQSDQYLPDHKPQSGDRIFVNMTKERALAAAKLTFTKSQGTDYPMPEDKIHSVADHYFGEGDQPDIITVP